MIALVPQMKKWQQAQSSPAIWWWNMIPAYLWLTPEPPFYPVVLGFILARRFKTPGSLRMKLEWNPMRMPSPRYQNFMNSQVMLTCRLG